MKRKAVSQVELFVLSGTIPHTLCTKKVCRPSTRGSGLHRQMCVRQKGGMLDSAERFMSVKTSFTRSWRLLAAPWDTLIQ